MQPEKLIELFNAHKVKYLLIGAAACSAHGFARAFDLIRMKRAAGRPAQRQGRSEVSIAFEEVQKEELISPGNCLCSV